MRLRRSLASKVLALMSCLSYRQLDIQFDLGSLVYLDLHALDIINLLIPKRRQL